MNYLMQRVSWSISPLGRTCMGTTRILSTLHEDLCEWVSFRRNVSTQLSTLNSAHHFLLSISKAFFSNIFALAGQEWPPKDDDHVSESSESNDEGGKFLQDSSPWTYESGLNPALRPTNSELRSRRRRRLQNGIPGSSVVPPYHPDYRKNEAYAHEAEEYSEDTASSEEGLSHPGKSRIRRGSEGYEVRQEGREDMLKRYLTEIGEDPNRYLRYIPQPDEDSGEDEDDNIPLSYHKERLADETGLQ